MGMKIYTNEKGHMTKVAAMPTYGMVKTFKNFLLQTQLTDGLGTWYVAYLSTTKIVK